MPLESFTGVGNAPAFTRRQSVDFENGTKRNSSRCRTNPVSGNTSESSS